MTTVPIINSGHIHINALFIQPTTMCRLNCKGCYVKGGFDQHKSEQVLNKDLFNRLIYNLNKENYINTNQVTLAVDYYEPKKENSDQLRRYATTYVNNAEDQKNKEGNSHLPEFHATIYNVDQMIKYYVGDYNQEASSFDVIKWWSALDLVSISHLHTTDTTFLHAARLNDLKINWNYQPFYNNIDKEFNKIKTILPIVESMYFIIHKPDLGHKLDQKNIDLYQNLWEKLKKELDPELFTKINKDGCVSDAKKFIDTGHGCSSNVSRFQIWPGGHVSGCPYRHKPETKAAETVDELFANIRQVAQKYEFNDCKIPSSLYPNHGRIVEQESPYLRVLD